MIERRIMESRPRAHVIEMEKGEERSFLRCSYGI